MGHISEIFYRCCHISCLQSFSITVSMRKAQEEIVFYLTLRLPSVETPEDLAIAFSAQVLPVSDDRFDLTRQKISKICSQEDHATVFTDLPSRCALP